MKRARLVTFIEHHFFALVRSIQVLRTGKKAAVYNITVAYHLEGAEERAPAPSMLNFMGGGYDRVDLRFARVPIESIPLESDEVRTVCVCVCACICVCVCVCASVCMRVCGQ